MSCRLTRLSSSRVPSQSTAAKLRDNWLIVSALSGPVFGRISRELFQNEIDTCRRSIGADRAAVLPAPAYGERSGAGGVARQNHGAALSERYVRAAEFVVDRRRHCGQTAR